ncbi:MATE family efflux transporter [Desulfonatronum lacustre]|uniref:MATE family efflux transporter n=1 Tax=Desulfonatronum lacustre TaxID=66849 RepID=UPI0004B06FFD|nr:MATE family efflux transporter [Desulfonatronum lacustre]
MLNHPKGGTVPPPPPKKINFDPAASPTKAIWRLAWPQVVMMLFHFLIGFVDVWVAGRISRDVQASMGMVSQSFFIFLVVAIAVSNGTVAAISQSYGAGLIHRVQRYVGLSLQTAAVFGAAFLVFGYAFQGSLIRILQTPESMLPIMTYLLSVYLLILPAYYLFIIGNAILRAQQLVLYPLYCMMLVAGLNTFGDFALGLGMFGFPDLGYKGLAWSTFGSVLAGGLFNVWVLRRRRLLVRRSFAPWKWIRCAFPYLFRVAWPAGVMQLVWHSAYITLFSITASLPAGSVVALAGMSAGMRVESLMFLPGFAFNFTAGILVGHYLGARKPEEAKRMGYRILGQGLLVICLLTVVLWQFLEPIAAFVAPDPEVRDEAVNYLRYNLAAMPFLLISMILGGALTGAGATIYQSLIMGGSAWLVRIPLAFVLGHLIFAQATGIWLAMFLSMAVQALCVAYVYQFWNWQRFAMRKQR